MPSIAAPVASGTTSLRARTGFLLLALALLAWHPAASRTLAVPDDHGSIGAALAAAQAGDIILVGCGVYRESGLQMKSGVSLWSGTLQAACATIDAGGRGRVLEFADCDSNTAVVGFTLRGGVDTGDGGAVLCRDSEPRISRCIIQDSRARRGGGLAVVGVRGPRLEDCRITGNEADLHGGGVFWNADGPARLLRCTVDANAALAGGGLACQRGDGLELRSVSFLDNRAAGSGGGVWVGGGGVTLRDCIIARNHGGLGGGALACRDGRPRLVSCTMVDNQVESVAGGLLVQAGAPRLENSIIAFNGAGAASVDEGAELVLRTCDVFGHEGGDWSGPLAEQAGRDGNFSLDPRFCSRSSGSYELSARSPCLPANRGGDELVGALGRGCP